MPLEAPKVVNCNRLETVDMQEAGQRSSSCAPRLPFGSPLPSRSQRRHCRHRRAYSSLLPVVAAVGWASALVAAHCCSRPCETTAFAALSDPSAVRKRLRGTAAASASLPRQSPVALRSVMQRQHALATAMDDDPATVAGGDAEEWPIVASAEASGPEDSDPGAAMGGDIFGVSKQAALVFGGTYLAYASSYFARNNAAVVKAPLLGLQGLLEAPISPTAVLGCLDAGFLIAYALGSFIVPAVLDLDNQEPWKVVWIGLAVAGVSQLGLCLTWFFLLGPSFGYLQLGAALVFCLLNGFAQSVLYPTCKKLMADTFGSNGTILGAWNTCYYLGGVASTLIAAGMVDSFSWPAAFLGPGLILLLVSSLGAVSPLFLAWAGSQVARVDAAGALERREAAKPTGDGASGVGDRLWQLLRPSRLEINIVAGQYFAIKLIRYVFGLWLPLLLVASRGALEDGGGLLEVGRTAATFDIGSIVGSLAVGALAEKLGKGALPALVLGTSLSLALLLPVLPSAVAASSGAAAAAAASASMMMALLALGIATGGAETLLGSICPIHYALRSGGSVSSAVASVNGYGSLGTVASALVLPLLAGSSGATDLASGFASLAPLAGMASLAAFFQITDEWSRKDDD
mmetsp:Transcript_26679/g.76364  ORF Transcript_26679/g.76364 Transcript_26679/m.76364 type:complete len:630 (+) Transcript_26679:58-1947(+)